MAAGIARAEHAPRAMQPIIGIAMTRLLARAQARIGASRVAAERLRAGVRMPRAPAVVPAKVGIVMIRPLVRALAETGVKIPAVVTPAVRLDGVQPVHAPHAALLRRGIVTANRLVPERAESGVRLQAVQGVGVVRQALRVRVMNVQQAICGIALRPIVRARAVNGAKAVVPRILELLGIAVIRVQLAMHSHLGIVIHKTHVQPLEPIGAQWVAGAEAVKPALAQFAVIRIFIRVQPNRLAPLPLETGAVKPVNAGITPLIVPTVRLTGIGIAKPNRVARELAEPGKQGLGVEAGIVI